MRKLLTAAIVATAAMALGATSANAAEIRAYANPWGDNECGQGVNCGAELVTSDGPIVSGSSWAERGDCNVRLQMVLGNSGDGSAVDVTAYPSYIYEPAPAQTANHCKVAELCESPWHGEFTAATSHPSSIELRLDWCYSIGSFGGWRGPVTLYPNLAEPAAGMVHRQLTRATAFWEPLTGYGSLTDRTLLADFTETPHEMWFSIQ